MIEEAETDGDTVWTGPFPAGDGRLFGFAVLIRPWQYSERPWVFAVGFLLGGLSFALLGHVALAYPPGRVVDRLTDAHRRPGEQQVHVVDRRGRQQDEPAPAQ